MARVLWGLDLGDWSLKVARASYEKKTDTITVDVMDEIVYGELPCGFSASPLEKHRAAIVAFRARFDIGPRDHLCVSVSGGEVFSRFINLPPVLERIDEIIGYEARQQIPFDINDVVWDWQPVKEEHEIEPGEEVEVGIFALKKERVAELMDLLEPWKGNLRVVQNAPLAAHNLLAYEGLADEPVVVLDIGAATTDVLVLNPPRFWVRTLLVAGGDLTNALIEQFGVGEPEAEKVKRRLGRSSHKERVLRILQPVFDDLISEVQRSLGYYKSLVREVKFARVVALGGGLEMAGLTQMLSAGLQYDVRTVRELKRVQFAPSLEAERVRALLPRFCPALGLLVQGAGLGRIRINMVPEEIAMTAAVDAKKPWLVAAGVGLLLIAVLLSLGQYLYAQDIAQSAQKIGRLSLIDQVAQWEKDYNSAMAAVNRLEGELRTLAKGDVPRDLYLELLPMFAEVLPPSVHVVNLQLRWQEPTDISDSMARIGDWGTVRARRVASSRTTARTTARPSGPPMGMAQQLAAQQAAIAAVIASEEAQMGGPPTEEGGVQRGGRGSGRRRRGASAAGRRGRASAAAGVEVQPLVSNQSRLVLQFACESGVPKKSFIQEKVFDALRDARLPDPSAPGGSKPAFTEVRMLGDVQDIWRDQTTLERVAGPGEGDEVKQFVAFEGYAVVNAGPAGEKPQAKSARSRRR